MKYTCLLVLPLMLASLACLETTLQAGEIAQSAPTVLPTSAPTHTEPDSGTVYQIPTVKTQTCAIVTASIALHVRAEPDHTSRVVDWLYTGEIVTVTSTFGAWRGISAGQTTGYAHSAYLTETECE